MDLVEELMKLDWSYTHKDGKNFINNEKAFNESATFKIINGTFNNPFDKTIEVPYKTKPTRNNIPTESKEEPPTKKCEDNDYVKLESLHVPLYPDKSLLKPVEHELGLKVLGHYWYNGPVISSRLMPASDVTNAEMIKFTRTLLPNINKERQMFAEYVQKIWAAKHCSRHLNIIDGHQKYIEERWKEQLDAVIPKYPQYYQSATMIPLVSQPGEPVELEEMKILKTKLCYGPRLHVPNLGASRFHLAKNYERIKKKHINHCDETKFTVNNDETCEQFAVENIVNVVTSPECIRCIVNNIAPFHKTWNIPFTVKEYQVKDSKGKPLLHTVVYMDPPLPPQTLTTKEKSEWAFSTILKNSLLRGDIQKSNDISFVEVKCDFCKVKTSEVSTNVTTIPEEENNDTDELENDDTHSSDDEEKLVMDVDETVSSTPSQSEVRGVVTRSRVSGSKAPVQPEGETSETPKKIKLDVEKCTCVKKKIRLNTNSDNSLSGDNFSYHLWKLRQSSEVNFLSKTSRKDVMILVRSKGDCYTESDNIKKTCILEPKLEYQFEFGYEYTTPEEAATQWTLLNFNPDSHLIRARVHSSYAELLVIEKYDSKTYSTELAKQNAWIPSKAKCALFDVFSHLSQLRQGQYLLSHQERHGAFAVVYTNTPQRCENGLDLKELFNINMSDMGLKQTAPWTPIDCNLPTELHIKYKIMPCMFNPKARIFCVTKESPKKKKMKSKGAKKWNKRKKQK